MASLIPDPVSGRNLDLNLDNLSSESIPLNTVLYNHFFCFSVFLLQCWGLAVPGQCSCELYPQPFFTFYFEA